MALERKAYTRPLIACTFVSVLQQCVGGLRWFALKTLGVSPVEASIGADLGGSSK